MHINRAPYSVPQAERFRTQNGICTYLYILACFLGSISFRMQNGSAGKTVPHTQRFREQNGSARRTVPYVERFRTQSIAVIGTAGKGGESPKWEKSPFFWPPLSWGARGQKKGGLLPFGWVATFSQLKMGNHQNGTSSPTHTKNYWHTFIYKTCSGWGCNSSSSVCSLFIHPSSAHTPLRAEM